MYAGPWKSAIWRDRAATKLGRRRFGDVYKNVDFWKILGMAWPIVENVPTPCGSIYCVSRGSQLPYMKKSENPIVYIFLLFNSRYTALAA